MTVKELLRDWLDDEHYVGLCNPELECGCGLDDLMPCGSNCGECQPAAVFENGAYWLSKDEGKNEK